MQFLGNPCALGESLFKAHIHLPRQAQHPQPDERQDCKSDEQHAGKPEPPCLPKCRIDFEWKAGLGTVPQPIAVARHDAKRVVLESYNEVGYNFRLTDMQAAIGLVQLGRVEDFIERRRAFTAGYTEGLLKIGWLIPPREPAGYRHNFQSYMARLAKGAPISRDDLMQTLLDRGISTRRGIMAAHREAPYHSERWDWELTETSRATDECIILPLFHQMTDVDQEFVLESIREISV